MANGFPILQKIGKAGAETATLPDLYFVKLVFFRLKLNQAKVKEFKIKQISGREGLRLCAPAKLKQLKFNLKITVLLFVFFGNFIIPTSH